MTSGADPAVTAALADAYYDIRRGWASTNRPRSTVRFQPIPIPTRRWNGGARQPGMTGQVKEEIITRWGELGVKFEQGALCFSPTLLRSDEFLQKESDFTYFNLSGEPQTLRLSPGSLAFTLCQTPIIYQRGAVAQIETIDESGQARTLSGHYLDIETTLCIINRDGTIAKILVTFPLDGNS